MNIYYCVNKCDCYGFYISASSRGRAKEAFCREDWDGNFLDVRTNIVKKDVDMPDCHVLNEDECIAFDLPISTDEE